MTGSIQMAIQHVRSLTSAFRDRRLKNPRVHVVLPIVLAIADLAFCAWISPLLLDDPEGYRLTLYFLVQITLALFFTIGIYLDATAELLEKTRMMPIRGWVRYLFTLIVSLVSLPMLLLWGANLAFLLLQYRQSGHALVVSVVIFTLVIVCVAAVTSIAMVGLKTSPAKRSRLVSATFVVMLFFFLSIYAFRSETVLTRTPVLAWAVDGIFAAEEGGLRQTLVETIKIFLVTGLTMVAGALLSERMKDGRG